MHVGNDVVDLRDPETRSFHPRFDLRVFTRRERAHLERATLERARLSLPLTGMQGAPAEALSHRLRWTMWAAKEAAFKAARKLHPDVPFHPRRFAVELLERGRARVFHDVAGRFELWLEEARDWVHAVAAPADGCSEAGARPHQALARLDPAESLGGEPGRRVRQLAVGAVASLLRVDPSELRVVADGAIPRMMRGRDRLPLDLSLSHHGRMVACAWRDREG